MRSFFGLHVELGVAVEGGVGHDVGVVHNNSVVDGASSPLPMMLVKAYRRLPRLTMPSAL